MYLKCIECEGEDSFKAGHYKEAAMCMKQHDTQKYLKYISNAI